MYVIVWMFNVRPEQIPAFVAAYRSQGAWAKLFSLAPGYQGTELLCCNEREATFLTIDRWNTGSDFVEFHRRFGSQYESLDLQCNSLTISETKIGIFAASPLYPGEAGSPVGEHVDTQG